MTTYLNAYDEILVCQCICIIGFGSMKAMAKVDDLENELSTLSILCLIRPGTVCYPNQ